MLKKHLQNKEYFSKIQSNIGLVKFIPSKVTNGSIATNTISNNNSVRVTPFDRDGAVQTLEYTTETTPPTEQDHKVHIKVDVPVVNNEMN